jgi:hypothetical protein
MPAAFFITEQRGARCFKVNILTFQCLRRRPGRGWYLFRDALGYSLQNTIRSGPGEGKEDIRQAMKQGHKVYQQRKQQ